MEVSHRIGISIHLWELTAVISHQFVPLLTNSKVSRQFPSTFLSTDQVHISPNVGNPAEGEGNNTHFSPLVSTPLIREEMRLVRQDMSLVNTGWLVPNAFSFMFLEMVIPLLTDNK